jgi:dTDP-4-dehydrorhamnose reductase
MKILVTGANGFIGYYLVKLLLAQKNIKVIATGLGKCRLPFEEQNFIYASLDFTCKADVEKVFLQHLPTHVVHAGAISKPDDCELNKLLADKINIEGTKNLLDAAKIIQAYFLLISTDFVFEGTNSFYTELDKTTAVNYYGHTKIEAEKLVQQYVHHWGIIRIALVYGKPFTGRNNMVTLVKEKLEKGEEYKVFSDQMRTPTYVQDVVQGILLMIQKNAKGIYHIAGQDVLSPYDIAVATAKYLQLDEQLIKSITAKDLIQPALRPAITTLNIDKARIELGYSPLSFEEGLRLTLC